MVAPPRSDRLAFFDLARGDQALDVPRRGWCAWVAIKPQFERKTLTSGEIILDANQVIPSLCFPESGVVSFQEILNDGRRVGVGIVGFEGMVGWPVLLGSPHSPQEAVPVRASTYSRREDPHEYIDRLDFFADRQMELSHFKRTLTQKAFAEILGFFDLIGEAPWDAYDDFRNGVEYAVWATGDFKAKVPMDFSDVTLTVVGLQFDRKALLSSFGEESQPPETRAIAIPSNGGGRPRKYDWEGAIIHIAALANHPDGLPTGAGAQAEIARRIADWFESAGGDCPADSEIRRRASRIMQALTAD